MLYPQLTDSRMAFDLNGVWDFKLLDEGQCPAVDGPIQDAIPMAVPSAYNDLYEGRAFKEHVGDMVYQRSFSVSAPMLEKRLVLRFSSATHQATVYLNGKLLGKHKGGFLPFEFEIGQQARCGENLLTVIVNNIVDYSTLPCGRLVTENYPGLAPMVRNYPNFDYFNYTGIMRPVKLYTTPRNYIRDITVVGHMDGSFSYKVDVQGEGEVAVEMLDPDKKCVFKAQGTSGEGKIENVRLWAPEHPALYDLVVRLVSGDEQDSYTEPFGFRDISIQNCRLCLNGKPVYLKGFGKHEDSYVNGRGFNEALNVKDVGLLKWIGANSFRTSHYPYSEEMMRLCDREGIMVIDEVPAVGLHTAFTATGMLGGEPNGTWRTLQTAQHHRDVINDLIARDKNHPCVVMWSVANEPASEEEGAREYFEPLTVLAREQDPQHRPVTIVTYEGSSPEKCKVAELCDVLVINRYRGWYDTEGNLPGAAAKLKDEFERFHARCPEKPIMLGEYGADTIAGMHDATPTLFSEEYQVAYLEAYSEVFDSLPYITGEHVWNFADFATAENIRRVQGNKKGIFTRDRRPKMAAHYLKNRWTGFEKE